MSIVYYIYSKKPCYSLTILFSLITVAAFSQRVSDTTFLYKVASKYIDVKGKVTRLTMKLSAFGVESDDFPNIDVEIDFTTLKNKCYRSYYTPKHHDSTYYLDSTTVMRIYTLLQQTNLDKLHDYRDYDESDQPSSTTTIYTSLRQYSVYDYGLEADEPLKTIYKLVYRYEY